MSGQQKGFTLIELAVVLLIMVLGMGVVGISISSGNQSSQMKATIRDLGSALRYARGQALISGKEVSVDVNLANNSYRVSNRRKTYHFSNEIDVTLEIAQDEFKEGEIAQIRFYADGSSSGGRITLEWEALIYHIDVNWLSGQVSTRNE